MAEIRDLLTFLQDLQQEFTLWNRDLGLKQKQRQKDRRQKLIGNIKQNISLQENSRNCKPNRTTSKTLQNNQDLTFYA